MNNVMLKDVFDSHYLPLLHEYVNEVNSLMEKCDVLVFVARKAACFYYALRRNDLVANPQSRACEVFNSRILDLGRYDLLEGKHVALIDDVAISGNSIEAAAKSMSMHAIEPVIHLAAISERASDHSLFASLARVPRLEHGNLLKLAKQINAYVDSSMVSNNVDSPVYYASFESAEAADDFFHLLPSLEVTSSMQRKNRIRSRTVCLNVPYFEDTSFGKGSTFKIRMYLKNGHTEVALIPFILMPEMPYKNVLKIYHHLKKEYSSNYFEDEATGENALYITQYLLSDLLVRSFVDYCEIGKSTKKSIEREQSTFGCSVKRDVSGCLGAVQVLNADYRLAKGFLLSEKYQQCLDYILYSLNSITLDGANYFSVEDIGRFLFQEEPYIGSKTRVVVFSAILDMLIDQGVLVPSIKLLPSGKLARVYRQGEIANLTLHELKGFAVFLSLYMEEGDAISKRECELVFAAYFLHAHVHFPGVDDSNRRAYSVLPSWSGPIVAKRRNNDPVESSPDSTLLAYMVDESLIALHGENVKLGEKGLSANARQDLYEAARALKTVILETKKSFVSLAPQTRAALSLHGVSVFEDLLESIILGGKVRSWYLTAASPLLRIVEGEEDGLTDRAETLARAKRGLERAARLLSVFNIGGTPMDSITELLKIVCGEDRYELVKSGFWPISSAGQDPDVGLESEMEGIKSALEIAKSFKTSEDYVSVEKWDQLSSYAKTARDASRALVQSSRDIKYDSRSGSVIFIRTTSKEAAKALVGESSLCRFDIGKNKCFFCLKGRRDVEVFLQNVQLKTNIGKFQVYLLKVPIWAKLYFAGDSCFSWWCDKTIMFALNKRECKKLSRHRLIVCGEPGDIVDFERDEGCEIKYDSNDPTSQVRNPRIIVYKSLSRGPARKRIEEVSKSDSGTEANSDEEFGRDERALF